MRTPKATPWQLAGPRQWEAALGDILLRVKQVGLQGDANQFLAYRGKQYIGCAPTLEAAQARAATGKVRIDPVPAPKPTAPPEPAKPAKQRSKFGMLTAHDLAKRIGCDAKLVRRALRTTKTITKPTMGWVFTEDEAPKVIAVVKQWLQTK